MEKKRSDIFEVYLEVFDESGTAFFVTAWFDMGVEHSSNFAEVDGLLLDQSKDKSGEKFESAVIPMEVGFQSVLELGMLVRRASDSLCGRPLSLHFAC